MSSLESSMIWAPVEAMTQVSRNTQKVIAKDIGSLMTQLKSLQTLMPKEATNTTNTSGSSSTPLTPDQLSTKTKLQLTKTLQGMMKEVQQLKRKLEDSDKLAHKHARLCSHRLHYLKHVEQLAHENKTGTSEYDRMEEENGIVSPPPTVNDTDSEPKRIKLTTRNSQEMDIDSTSTVTPISKSSLSLTASSSTSQSKSVPASVADETNFMPNFSVTPQLRLDRIFADHLLRTNRPQTAAALISSTPELGSLVDTDIFLSGRKIELSLLEQHDCTRALAWCGENRSRLNKIQSPLEFDLRLQEFLSLVQQKQPIKAIEYARKFLAPAAITTTTATNVTTGTPATNPSMTRTNSLPERTPPDSSTGLLQRNNSLGPTNNGHDDDKKDENGSTTMVADPARVKILQEAMNLLVFYGFEQEEEQSTPANTNMTDVSQSHTNGTTAITVPPAWHKYRVYWSPTRFQELARQFQQTRLAIYGLPEQSVMEYVLNIGLSCIKTSSCKCSHTPSHDQPSDTDSKSNESTTNQIMESDDEEEHKSSSTLPTSTSTTTTAASPSNAISSSSVLTAPSPCPACIYPFSCLSHTLPVAQRTHSRLVCSLSGALMDDTNPPMVLPNGYVYSRLALQQMAKLNDGQITCPRTKQQFAFTQAKMAYVL